ncbi:MAG TPA: ParB/RepB/Spo0J family partition protein [Solirubrobacteraceae bacterium]|jgi:ParB/RepB/Spo0J family partition protein|nr:ParB/RepB/Spo0J family partition protein [Solirubrobacteraceae bacterium]
MSTVTAPARAAIELIDVGENSRELDSEHVKALADSIALRGLIVPLLVSPQGDRFKLIAGHHRFAACKSLGLSDVEITLREQEGTSADSAAENVVRKALNPLEEARAVGHMLEEGYTLDGAATVLGWNRKLVSARAKILELPEIAQRLLASGTLPVGSVSMLAAIAAVSPGLCEAALQCVADGEIDGEQFASSPGWAIGYALRNGAKGVFAAHLSSLSGAEIAELRLGKKALAAYAEAEALHRKLDSYAYGPPQVRFSEQEVDQARAGGVLIEFEHGTPIITDRELLRELARQAIERTLAELSARAEARQSERANSRAGIVQSPKQALDAEHRAKMRELTTRAHATNLDLGAALLKQLANVKPDDLEVARFFVYGLLGPESSPMSASEGPVAVIAANGVRLVIEEHRTSATPTLKSGKPGVTKVSYGEPEEATRWLWRFIEGAGSAGELYGRALVVFAAQAYAHDLVLPASKRRSPALPRSRKETARKAFERITKKVLPATHVALARALEREARRYAAGCEALQAPSKSEASEPMQQDAN